jgi:hypothetical protein
MANQVRLRLYQAGDYHDLELELAPGEQRSIEDVMDRLDLTGTAPLRVFSSEPLMVGSRTFNKSSAGTFGQYIGSTPPTQGLATGDSTVLM